MRQVPGWYLAHILPTPDCTFWVNSGICFYLHAKLSSASFMAERETLTIKHETSLSPIRAVRSLAWNRRVLPVVQERLERAESVVRAHLLLNGNGCLRVGSYEVSLNGNEEIIVNRIEASDWRQLPLPESGLASVDPVEGIVGIVRSENGSSTDTSEDDAV